MKMGCNARTSELIHVFVALLFLVFMFDNAIAAIKCLEREKKALLQLKQGLIDSSDRLSSWRSVKDCCKWQGIKCNNLTGHVLTLDLHAPRYSDFRPYAQLTSRGKLTFSSLVELQHLNYLDLSFNEFTDNEIPPSIGSLKELRHLDLSYSWFTGTIPHHLIGNLTHLQTLNLGFNEGLNVDNLEWISNLRALRYIDLSLVDLNNTNWWQPIQKLSFLTELHLVGCQISLPLTPLTNSSYMPLLSVVDLSSNGFNTSSQPFNWLFKLWSSLVDVDISYNNLQGLIPDVFRNLTHLQSLDLGNNNFAGDVSEVLDKWSDGAKKSIEVLNLSWNELSGSLPDFSRFTSLKKFSVSHNKLNEPLPDSFGQQPSLVFLDLSYNQITGSLPNQSSFPNLEYFDLRNNNLKGRLTESIGQFSELITLDLSLNSFEDTITGIHFMKLSKLRVLDLSDNSLVFDVSFDWIPPFQLDVIALGHCKLGPRFPKWLQTQNNYSLLHIPHANISDVIPNWFWNLPQGLTYLNLANNKMTGVIPDLSSKLSYLSIIDLSSNQFNGSFPLLPPYVRSLDLSKNGFAGPISSLCDLSGMEYLDLSDNLLSGELPDCWLQFGLLYILNLANNYFSGEIPSSFGFLNSLESVHLRNNNFIGELPTSLMYCRGLRLFDLAGNELSGRFPEWIGIYMKDLIIFSISQNKFNGSIPDDVCNLNKIQVLDLSQNNISGHVPKCFNNFTSLVESNESVEIIISTYKKPYYYDQRVHQCLGRRSQNGCESPKLGGNFDRSIVQWKGQSSEFAKSLEQLKVIDLSSNNLTGEIPVELTSLVYLHSLNLSKNAFTGHIPQKIGQMKMLESMDLSQNRFSGQIPLELASLNYLSVLDLSNNNFSGRIPSGTQLQGFNSSVYTGNHNLCGLPLAKKCYGDEVGLGAPASKDKNVEGEDGDEVKTPGFYVSLILGLAVGFWGSFGTLQLKHSWRDALLKFLIDMKDRVYVAVVVNMARIQRMRRG